MLELATSTSLNYSLKLNASLLLMSVVASSLLQEPEMSINIPSTEEVLQLLSQMKLRNCQNPGGIPIRLIKNISDSAVVILKITFNRCLVNLKGSSKELKMAYLSSINKKGSKNASQNYRGII